MKRRPTSNEFREQLDAMIEQLCAAIASGKYGAGDRLPSEKDLAAQYGLSNNSVRKGLQQMVDDGWIEKVPRVGNRVAQGRTGRRPVTLTLACSETARRNLDLDRLLQDLHRRYPWLTVRTESRSGSGIYSRLDGPDLVLMDNTEFRRMAEADQVDGFRTLEPKDGLYPSLCAVFRHRGKQRLLPVIFSPIVLCYNKAHFREAGLQEPDGTWTWEEFTRNAELLSDGKGRYGFASHILDGNRWPIFLMQSAERLRTEDGQPIKLEGSRLLHGLKLCKALLHNRKASPLLLTESSQDTLQLFMEGRLSMVLNSYMGLNVWKDSGVDYDVTPIPFIDEPRTLMLSLGVGVRTSTRHPEEAMLAADYFTSSQARDCISDHTLSIPALRPLPPLSPRATVRRPERFGLYREMMFSCRTHSDLNVPMAMLPDLFQPLKAFWADMIGEEELCKRMSDILAGQMKVETGLGVE